MLVEVSMFMLGYIYNHYAHVKVNVASPLAYDRGLSDHTWDSDNNVFLISFRHHSDITYAKNIDVLRGDPDSES